MDDRKKRLALADELERRLHKLPPGGVKISIGIVLAREIVAALRDSAFVSKTPKRIGEKDTGKTGEK